MGRFNLKNLTGLICKITHSPEKMFVKDLFNNINLFDSIIKSPDKSFYNFPYSYKPSDIARTHPKHKNFNPDFFIKLKDKKEILVIEIKSTDDDSKKNKAKNRDGQKHFEILNNELENKGFPWHYCFYFLSPEDYSAFFQAIQDQRYDGWESQLMQKLS